MRTGRKAAGIVFNQITPHLIFAWCLEINTRFHRQAITELFFQGAGTDFFHCAFAQFAQLERAERNTDQAVDHQTEVLKHNLDLAVFAFAQVNRKPSIGALAAIQRGMDGFVIDAVNRDPVLELVQSLLCGVAVRSHAVTPEPGSVGMRQHTRKAAIVGQEQKSLRVDIQPTDRYHTGQIFWQIVKNCRAAFRVALSCHQPSRLVVEPQPCSLPFWQRITVDHNFVFGGDVECRAIDNGAIDADTPFRNPFFSIAARA